MKIKHKKLKEWVSAGLITEGQGDAIHAYEENKRSGRFGRGMVGLALFAIVLGVLSIIASNWHVIPGEVKIGVHVLLNLAAGWIALRADRAGKDIIREGAALAFIGLTFTLIALIGQVYQLDGSFEDATIFWFLITLPFFILMGRSYMTAAPWTALLVITLFFLVSKLAANWERLHIPFDVVALILNGAVFLLPLAFLGAGLSRFLQRCRPALADIWWKTVMVWMALFASATLAMWGYPSTLEIPEEYDQFRNQLIILTAGLLMIGAHALVHGFYKNDDRLRAIALFTGVSFVCMLGSSLLMPWGNEILSAIAFIGYWLFIGWLAQSAGKMRIVSLAIFIITIRIFIIYIELFGSLLLTGFGLISGGLVMLALLWAARKTNKYFRRQEQIS
jgi:uncharacterized membrane protein